MVESEIPDCGKSLSERDERAESSGESAADAIVLRSVW